MQPVFVLTHFAQTALHLSLHHTLPVRTTPTRCRATGRTDACPAGRAVTSKWFEPVTFVFVVVNLGLLASYRYDNSPARVHTIDRATQGFAWFFMVEVVARATHEGVHRSGDSGPAGLQQDADILTCLLFST